jgi:CRP/FNR family transcriptional regulator, cyclic AMP receptor protein
MTDRTGALDELSREGLAGGFFFDLPPGQADRLLSESIRIDLPAGGVVYREGDAARCFVVVRGLLRSFMSSRDGREVTFRYGKNGDVMGLASVIGDPLPVTIQAMTSSAVVAVRVDSLRRMLETDPLVAQVCARELTRQLNQALEDVAQSAFHTVRQRIARQLLDLAVESDDSRLVAHVTHQELADAIASSREVVSRSLHEMHEDGLVDTGHDRLVVLIDVAGLAREVEAGPEATTGQTRTR